MGGELGEVRIAPVGNPYHLSVLSLLSRNLQQLQHVKSSRIEKESMRPKQFAELLDCRMILGKYLCFELG